MIVLAQIRAWRIRPTDPVVFSGSSSGGVHDANAVSGVPDPYSYPAGMLADAYVDYRTYGRMQMLAQDMQSFNAFLSYLKVMDVERVVVERLPLLPARYPPQGRPLQFGLTCLMPSSPTSR